LCEEEAMQRTVIMLLSVGLALALVSCEIAGGPAGEEELSDEVVAEAAESAMEVASLALAARWSGDYSGLSAYLAANDPDREVLAALEKHGVFAAAPAPKGVPGLPPFAGGAYMNGDVLVCKGSGSGISNLMEMILVRGYGHAGILNKELANAGAASVLSADIDYLTAFEPGRFALTYETYEGWRDGNDTVTVLRKAQGLGNLPAGFTKPFDDVYNGYHVGSVYAFFGYAGIEYGAFEPIPRIDSKYWYCSKTAWRVLHEASAGGIDSEQANFYFGADDKWRAFKDSLLYDLLKVYLYNKAPFAWWKWWKWSELERAAEAKLADALEELVTPDELRAWDGFGYAQPYGNTSYDATVWTGYTGY
jgi:hypothetical protein